MSQSINPLALLRCALAAEVLALYAAFVWRKNIYGPIFFFLKTFNGCTFRPYAPNNAGMVFLSHTKEQNIPSESAVWVLDMLDEALRPCLIARLVLSFGELDFFGVRSITLCSRGKG